LQTISVSLDYNTGPLGLDVHNQRSGPTAMLDQRLKSAGGMDQQVHAKWVTDVRASYQLRPRVGVAISAANLFDVYPDQWLDFNDGVNARGFSNHGMFRYPGAVSEAGQNGRTLYLQVEYR
jgi:outer membrane receptor protein involved in Fe transport